MGLVLAILFSASIFWLFVNGPLVFTCKTTRLERGLYAAAALYVAVVGAWAVVSA